MDCAEVEANAAAFALGALTRDEREAMAQRLGNCPGAAELVAQHSRVAMALLFSPPHVAPPASVKAGLMEAIASAQPPSATDAQWWKRLFSGLPPVAKAGLAFAALVVVFTVAGLGMANLFGQPSPQLVAAQLSKDPSATSLPLLARAAAPAASGTLLFKADGTFAVLHTEGLPALAEDRVYQLWLVYADGRRDTGALFREGGDVLVTAPRAFGAYVRFGITIEPAGGSPGPTGPGVLST